LSHRYIHLVAHPFGLGHHRIAHITAAGRAAALARRRGYEAARTGHGLAEHVLVASGETTRAGGRQAIDQLLDSGVDEPGQAQPLGVRRTSVSRSAWRSARACSLS
jgi:DNA-binding LacI/PurR family transcriptional regulator